MPIWLREKLFLKDLLLKELKYFSADYDWSSRLRFTEHHLSHAASAFFPSPFDEAAVLTIDGVGEWATTSLAVGKGNKLEVIKEIYFPHSIGLLYSAFTYYIGFKVNSGEYKVMGLAPYGDPIYKQLILDHLIDLKPDGSFRLNQSYFNYSTGITMTSGKFHELFGSPPRQPEDTITQRHMDLASSIQAVIEEVMLRLTRAIRNETGIRNLCLAGGVALNCVANGKVLRDGKFDSIWIQPAAGDAGGALGAALAIHHLELSQQRVVDGNDKMRGSYLGPEFKQLDIEQRLKAIGAKFSIVDDAILFNEVASALAEGKAVGWFQGRMEFGPRALGARSILGDARSPVMQSILNLKVKYRESFRPFAPSILRKDVTDWFELKEDSPYMLFVADLRKERRLQIDKKQETLFGIEKLNVPRSAIPAVTHVDYSARIQTVHEDTNPRFHHLISIFKQLTGCPVIINTSFNIRGEPIVCTPEEAFLCFMGTEIELLAIGNCILKKEEQDMSLVQNNKDKYELD
jgi:carbamoyltransferase